MNTKKVMDAGEREPTIFAIRAKLNVSEDLHARSVKLAVISRWGLNPLDWMG